MLKEIIKDIIEEAGKTNKALLDLEDRVKTLEYNRTI